MNRLVVLCKKVPDKKIYANNMILLSNDLSNAAKNFTGFINT